MAKVEINKGSFLAEVYEDTKNLLNYLERGERTKLVLFNGEYLVVKE